MQVIEYLFDQVSLELRETYKIFVSLILNGLSHKKGFKLDWETILDIPEVQNNRNLFENINSVCTSKYSWESTEHVLV